MPTREEVAALRQDIDNKLWTKVKLQELDEDELEGVAETDLFTVFVMHWIPLTVGRTDEYMVLMLGKLDKWPSWILQVDPEGGVERKATLCGIMGLNENGQEIKIIGDVIKRKVLRDDGTEVERDAVTFKLKTCEHVFKLIEHIARAFFFPYRGAA